MPAPILSLPLAMSLLAAAALPAATNPEVETPPALEVVDAGATPRDADTGGPFSYRRAALELGGVLALGAAWYEVEIDFNRQDFDFDRTWSSQWDKLVGGRGYRFDDNDRSTNIAHAFVGRTYHGLARTNHATMLQAFIFDLTASSVWEAAIENREVFSINDTVVTAVGGVPLGEASFQMGEFFARSAPTWKNRLMLAAFSPARAFLALTEGGRLPHAASVDRHGLATDATHRFALSAGGSFLAGAPPSSTVTAGSAAAATGPATATLFARLDAELINLRVYGREGRARRTLVGGEATGVELGYAGTPDRLDELTVGARTTLFGTFAQDLTGAPGDQHGESLIVAAGSAFDLALADGERTPDFLTAVHMIGPTADALLYRGPMTLRLSSDLYGDFAMVRPFALGPETPAAILDDTKSVLREHQYYYALGVTAAARAEARYRGLRAGAAVEWSGYDSIEGLDRQQETSVSPTGVYHAGVTDDFAITDQRVRLRVYTELPTPIDEIRLGFSFDVQHRSGEMKDLTRSEDEGRAAAMLSFVM